MKQAGKLIIFEGSDGAGKSTQVALLIKQLKKAGCLVGQLHFPQYGLFFGRLIRRYLKGEFGSIKQTNCYLISLLYALDRWQNSTKIKRWLAQGKIVILDRYITSNMIYQTAKLNSSLSRRQYLEWLDELEFKILKIPRPDLVIFLDLPIQISQELITRRGRKKDLHEANQSYLKSVQQVANQVIKKYHWQKIDCSRWGRILSRWEIHQQIWKVMEQKYSRLLKKK
ncbi:MAG: dTMP kinase [Candidatus Aenigmarchaeota archaeon]|nr:dTMP kinase [Candidatus Aenigmarchaeota archaeon]